MINRVNKEESVDEEESKDEEETVAEKPTENTDTIKAEGGDILDNMSLDQEDYGFGFLGLTLGPIIVLSGFIIEFFAISISSCSFGSIINPASENINIPFFLVILLSAETQKVASEKIQK